MSRFPFGIPNGWFAVSYSDELEAGAVRRLRYFDRELVLFRTETGTPAMLDAHCPHLGAHLGEGGTVVGETIRCPFHGRRFAVDGSCAEIPYAKTPGRGAGARAWHVIERNGLVLVWHHGDGAAPAFDVPVLDEWGGPDWTAAYTRRSWVVATHPQEILENAIDWPHFEHVHGMPAPEERDHAFEGDVLRWTVGASRQSKLVDATRDNFLIDSQSYGLGVSWLRYRGYYKLLAFAGATPVDAETTEIRLGVVGKHDGRSEKDTQSALEAFVTDQGRAMEHDIRIWENKAYRSDPELGVEDGPIRELRRWASRFYSGTTPPKQP